MLTPTGISRDEVIGAGRRLIRRHGKQVLLVASEGQIFAIANRCPHEGYPLSEGTLGPGCVLTCNWHNWKFDLHSGVALVGRDPVHSYPVAIRDGEIFVDLADPPADEQKKRAFDGLDVALDDVDLPRLARETARLERAGCDAMAALVHAFASRNQRLEDGMTHAHAAAADWLALANRATDPASRLAALLEPLLHIAWDTQGAGEFPYAMGCVEWSAEAFAAAIEAEDEAAAVACMRGAVAESIPYQRLRSAIGQAALAHYADFGHCAIYALKTGQLIERLGDEITEPALLALTRMLARATREERLPEFRGYAKALAEWDGAGSRPARAEDFTGLSVERALRRTLVSSGRPMRELYDALLGAAAWNLLQFDTRFERATQGPIADNVGWLDFTHALTFANACRRICEERPDLWPRAALQMALFVGRNRKYVQADGDVGRWHIADRPGFIAEEMKALYDHGLVEPIIACHRLKVLFALEDELSAAPDAPWADAMCAAVRRYLHTPMKRHHGLRTAAQALAFIAKQG
jgi:nitrite reductase/ring-hydroxylating ferredoxin subunit